MPSALRVIVALVAATAAAAYPTLSPLVPFPTPGPVSQRAPFQLLADRAASPALGVDSAAPLLSWAAPLSVAVQAAARVVLVQVGAAIPVWDSGFVKGAAPSMRYAGPALLSSTPYTWTVQLEDSAGARSEVSEPASLYTGMHSVTAATPVWTPSSANASAPALFAFFRTEQRLEALASDVVSAVLYVTAAPQTANSALDPENSKLLGAYKLWVNGALLGVGPGKASRCGPLCPVQKLKGKCTCQPEHLYDARDVTALVVGSGLDTLTLALACFNYPPGTAAPIESRVLLELRILYKSGNSQVMATAPTMWRAYDATAYMNPSGNSGCEWYLAPRENFDARLEPVGWLEPGFDDSAWPQPTEVAAFDAPLVARPSLALTLVDDPNVVRPPSAVLFYGSRVFVDFGIEFDGGVCADIANGVAGMTLDLRLAEEVVYSGEGLNLTLSAAPMRTLNNYSHTWTLRAGPQTICMHEYAQFRYCELSVSASDDIALLGLQVRAWTVFYAAQYVPVGALTVTSNGGAGAGGDADAAALLAVFAISHYTRAAQTFDMNFDHVRQRDVLCIEELTLDTLQQYALSAEWRAPPLTVEYVLNNGPAGFGWAEWPALALVSVHEIFVHTGDLAIFEAHYEQLRNFTLVSLVNASGLGLWECVGTELDCQNPEVDWPPPSRDGFVFTPTNTVVNAIAYRVMLMFSEMAAAAGGHDADAAYFSGAAAALRVAINTHLFDPVSGGYFDGASTKHRAWHSSVFALAMGVPTDELVPRVAAAMVSRLPVSNASATVCFPSNVWPTQWALEGLYRFFPQDHGALALAMMTCDKPSGWVQFYAQNFTQTAEAWNDALKGNQETGMTWSAAPGDVIPRLLLGVLPLTPGFATAIVRPQPGRLAGVSGTVPTLRGPISASFSQTFGSGGGGAATAVLELVLPGNLPTTACLPLSACQGARVSVDGVAIAAQVDGDYACVMGLSAAGQARRLQCPA